MYFHFNLNYIFESQAIILVCVIFWICFILVVELLWLQIIITQWNDAAHNSIATKTYANYMAPEKLFNTWKTLCCTTFLRTQLICIAISPKRKTIYFVTKVTVSPLKYTQNQNLLRETSHAYTTSSLKFSYTFLLVVQFLILTVGKLMIKYSLVNICCQDLYIC